MLGPSLRMQKKCEYPPPPHPLGVENVFDYRCVSDCRSRGREFDPGPVPYDHEMIFTAILLPLNH